MLKTFTLEVEIMRITQAKVSIEAEFEEEAIAIWEEEGFNGCCECREDNETLSGRILQVWKR